MLVDGQVSWHQAYTVQIMKYDFVRFGIFVAAPLQKCNAISVRDAMHNRSIAYPYVSFGVNLKVMNRVAYLRTESL